MLVRALTLWRPWAASIVHGPKRFENRPWAPPLRLLDAGLWIAIHAGRTWDRDGARFVAERWHKARSEVASPDGSLDGSARDERAWPLRYVEQGIVGLARVAYACRVEDLEATDPWAFGPFCWRLEDVRALADPIPLRGAQGLFGLSPEIEARVLSAIPS